MGSLTLKKKTKRKAQQTVIFALISIVAGDRIQIRPAIKAKIRKYIYSTFKTLLMESILDTLQDYLSLQVGGWLWSGLTIIVDFAVACICGMVEELINLFIDVVIDTFMNTI